MEEFESQIAKIQLGNPKATNAYVFTLAEKAVGNEAELYVVAELPLLNPAAESACEKICLAIAANLKRAYKKTVNENSFEMAISQINEELGKLASLGQTYWINKLNCIIGVKNKHTFTLATCGKVSAFLFRNGEFTDISCSAEVGHPLKTFENYASGKIKLGDVLILSTTQLFNYVSIDRLRSILKDHDFLKGTQILIELLKDNAGPQAAFATLLNQQVPPGEIADEQIDLESYIIETPPRGPNFWTKMVGFFKAAFALDKNHRVSQIDIPKSSLVQKFKNFGGNAKIAVSAGGRKILGTLNKGLLFGNNRLNLENFRNFTPQKKFFFVATILLLVALIANIFIAAHLKKVRKNQETQRNQLRESQTLIANAASSLLYKDEAAAKDLLQKAQSQLLKRDQVDKTNRDFYDTVFVQFEQTKQKLEKIFTATASTISTLGQAENLIKFPSQIAAQIGEQIISYDIQSGKLSDGILKSPQTILASVAINDTSAVIYNGESLLVWDIPDGKTGPSFSQSVPKKDAMAGLARYGVNNRVYLVNKKTGQIVSFRISGKQLAGPVIAAASNSEDLKTAQDLAIDGSIYVLYQNGITRYYAGKPAEFNEPLLLTPLSGKGKIYTSAETKQLYVLDSGNNRIVVLDKRGGVVQTLTNPAFTKLVDFKVDETNKIIYVLNDGTLLKVELP